MSRLGQLKRRTRAWIDLAPIATRSWATEAGVVPYRPGPWSTQTWDEAYGGGQLDYFAGLSERSRYSVLVGYLDQLAPIGSVLDVGCGPGLLFERCRHIRFDRWTGVDLSSTAVEAAASIADGRARFIAEDMLAPAATWKSERYDCVVVNEVLNMCDDPKRLIRLLRESLADPSSHLLISAWRHRGDRQLWGMIHSEFREVDRVDLRSSTSSLAPRGWRVALLEART